MYPAFLIVGLVRIFWLLVIYSLTRVLFLYFNFQALSQNPTSDIFAAFLHGVRFDLAGILYTNAPLLFMWLAPVRWQARPLWKRLELGLFFTLNLLFIGINILDVEFYKFMGKRLSIDIFGIQKDIQQQSVSVLLTYWHLVLIWLSLSFLALWLYRRTPVLRPVDSLGADVLWKALALALIVLGMRGGPQLKPLHPMNAYFTTAPELGALTLNTPFNFLKSRRTFEIPPTDFMEPQEAVRRVKALASVDRPPSGVMKGWNVVVVIVESFATEYMKYAPYFSELTKKGYYFPLNYANGRRSIEALTSILCGIPSLMEEPIVSSDFNNNELNCLAHVALAQGYSTHFLHGAYNGSMYMDTFSKRAGFDSFVGFNEYPIANRSQDDDHIWGILDEPMYQYAADHLDQAQKPFVLGLFTLSSHHPYYIPPPLRDKFPDGTLEIHKSIGYADYAIQKFFERAEKSDWFNKTIFIFTGDHIQKSDQPEFNTELGRYRVPLLVYIPGLQQKLPFDPNRVTQHVDIQATVFDLLGWAPEARTLLGRSVFDSAPGYAFNFNGNGWWYADSQKFIKLNMFTQDVKVSRQRDGLSLEEDPALAATAADNIQDLKALVQYTIQGIVKNSLYQWRRDL